MIKIKIADGLLNCDSKIIYDNQIFKRIGKSK